MVLIKNAYFSLLTHTKQHFEIQLQELKVLQDGQEGVWIDRPEGWNSYVDINFGIKAKIEHQCTVKWLQLENQNRKPCLWSKLLFSKYPDRCSKCCPLGSDLLYLRTFQWGTLWSCTFKDIKKYNKSKLRVQFLLSNYRHFKFDLSYFLYLLR